MRVFDYVRRNPTLWQHAHCEFCDARGPGYFHQVGVTFQRPDDTEVSEERFICDDCLTVATDPKCLRVLEQWRGNAADFWITLYTRIDMLRPLDGDRTLATTCVDKCLVTYARELGFSDVWQAQLMYHHGFRFLQALPEGTSLPVGACCHFCGTTHDDAWHVAVYTDDDSGRQTVHVCAPCFDAVSRRCQCSSETCPHHDGRCLEHFGMGEFDVITVAPRERRTYCYRCADYAVGAGLADPLEVD